MLNTVFLHRGLRSLQIEQAFCPVVRPEADDLFWTDTLHRGTTDLEILTLYRCDIETEALERMLFFPRALKRLELSDQHFDFWFDRKSSVTTEACVQALAQQSHSLEYLQLLRDHNADLGYHSIFEGRGARLGAFTSLKTLVTEMAILFGRYSRQSGLELINNWPGISTFLPQNLENLVLRLQLHLVERDGFLTPVDDNDQIQILLKLARDIRIHMPKLQTITLVDRRLFGKGHTELPIRAPDFEGIYAGTGVRVVLISQLPRRRVVDDFVYHECFSTEPHSKQYITHYMDPALSFLS